MAIIKGNGSSVTCTGTGLDLTTCKLSEFVITENGAALDATGFNDTSQLIAAGLSDWSASVTGTYPATPRSAHIGLVTFSSGYVLGCRGWSANIVCPAEETTDFADTWRAFVSNGPIAATGTFEVQIDDATKLAAVTAAGTDVDTLAATFAFDSGDATDQLDIDIMITQRLANVRRSGDTNAVYAWSSYGAIDMNTTLLATPGDLGLSAAGTFTGTADTGVTYTGSALYTGINITCNHGDVARATFSFQGTGALTDAQPA